MAVGLSVVLVTASALLVWFASASTADPAASARPLRPEDLGLQRLDVAAFCTQGAAEPTKEMLIATAADVPKPRLSEYAPKRSPLPRFALAHATPMDPAGEVSFLPGALEGFSTSYLVPDDDHGGFRVFAFQFLTRAAAADAAAEDAITRICELGGRPYFDGPILLVREDSVGESARAWWVNGSDLVVVDYSIFDDPAEELARFVTVARATFR